MKIIIGACISLPPYSPGMAWNWLHVILGLQKLGHDVYFVEEVAPDWCVDAQGQKCDFAHSLNQDIFRNTMQRFGLSERACQVYNHGEATFGLSLKSLITVSKEADLIINMSGHVKTGLILENIKQRVYVDQDPVYTQLWNAEYGVDIFSGHNVFLTVGLNIGTPYTHIPDCGITWRHILPPVTLEHWPVRFNSSCPRFTTVATWTGYDDVSYRGEWYRAKYEEFQRFAGLPTRVNQKFEVALSGYKNEDSGIRLLKDNGWSISEANNIRGLFEYQNYIAQSRGEIGIARNAYVKGCSGWFSDRSTVYLASGKPVLAQSTGFERCLPTGRGLLIFKTMDEAIAGIEAIDRDYKMHCLAAREFAEEYLDSNKVLQRTLEVAMGG